MIKYFINAACCVALLGLVGFPSSGMDGNNPTVEGKKKPTALKISYDNLKIRIDATKRGEKAVQEEINGKTEPVDLFETTVVGGQESSVDRLETSCKYLASSIESFESKLMENKEHLSEEQFKKYNKRLDKAKKLFSAVESKLEYYRSQLSNK